MHYPGAQPTTFKQYGTGRYQYVRAGKNGSFTVFRFRTRQEAIAAQTAGMELDHVMGSPPQVVAAVLSAAAKARKKSRN